MDFELSTEHKIWQKSVRDFVEAEIKPRARDVDAVGEFNSEAVKKMGPFGLLGLTVPAEHGGAGVDAVGAAIAIEELGRGCGSTGLSIAAHNGLGCSPIAKWGTPDQKERFFRQLAGGTGRLGALALTEPGAGSDLKGGVHHPRSCRRRLVDYRWRKKCGRPMPPSQM